jgi:hypothetical protein
LARSRHEDSKNGGGSPFLFSIPPRRGLISISLFSSSSCSFASSSFVTNAHFLLPSCRSRHLAPPSLISSQFLQQQQEAGRLVCAPCRCDSSRTHRTSPWQVRGSEAVVAFPVENQRTPEHQKAPRFPQLSIPHPHIIPSFPPRCTLRCDAKLCDHNQPCGTEVSPVSTSFPPGVQHRNPSDSHSYNMLRTYVRHATVRQADLALNEGHCDMPGRDTWMVAILLPPESSNFLCSIPRRPGLCGWASARLCCT